MKVWQGQAHQLQAAQRAFFKRAKLNSLAALGKYSETMEKEQMNFAA
jgi:fructose-bisphosphate aldolase class I